MLGVGYHVPAVAHEDHAAVEILDWIIGDTPSGRLYNELVKTGKASTVFSRIEAGHDPGMLLCFGQIEDDIDVDEFNQLMTSTLQKIVDEGVTEAEVKRAIAAIQKSKEEAPTDPEQFTMTLTTGPRMEIGVCSICTETAWRKSRQPTCSESQKNTFDRATEPWVSLSPPKNRNEAASPQPPASPI